MAINHFTFGKSLASVQLAAALSTCSSKTRRKVSSHISEFCYGLNSLALLPDTIHKCIFAKLWMEEYINHDLIISEPNISFDFDTTMKNVIKYRYRLWLESHNGYNKKELANRRIKNAVSEQKALDWIAQNLP